LKDLLRRDPWEDGAPLSRHVSHTRYLSWPPLIAEATSLERHVMLNRTSTRSAGLAAALLASLVIAPTASALPGGQVVHSSPATRQLPPDRVDKLGVIGQGGIAVPTVPDRVDKLGVTTAGPIAVPDRVDRLGTVNGPGSVAVASAPSSSSSSLTWSDLPVFAAAIFAIALLATIGSLMMRRRSGPALAS